ncbi:MAG TPA: PfaD family polyunsaturated fatty acid/polyketide biosynthesis protein [Deltaproteobacteria bacterium]|nr:PfaD family polyunsaturated fatty acid/polyketide biosynthesis protein [Deltaproteobacteria bacterium]
MSIATHFDALAVYRASAIRLVPTEGEPEDLLRDGGGLQASFDRLGQRVLLEVLRDPRIAEATLADGELSVTALREGAGGRLRVSWGDRVVVDDVVEIPTQVPEGPGPWFRPEPDSEVDAGQLWSQDCPVVAVEGLGGDVRWFTRGQHGRGPGQLRLRGTIPAIAPEDLGSASFQRDHGVRWAYVAGAMAGGIASAQLVVAMARAGLLGFFGAGGLPLQQIEAALEQVRAGAGDGAWGFNLLHNPTEPDVEERTVDLYLEHGVRRVSASAFMGLTPAIVRYRLSGIEAGPDGRPVCTHHVFAKVSRPEVAERFLRPAPAEMIAALLEAGAITEAQARLAPKVPMAGDLTAEADSGGHTDRRALVVLLPSMIALRDRIARQEGYAALGLTPRIGAAGGIGTPAAASAAFAMGADYVLTGSVNQATLEAGTSDLAKAMLAEAGWWEVASGPAPDMFELGAKVQVLSRGSMYAQRSQRLYDLYRAHRSMEEISDKERSRIEKQMFRRPLQEVWEGTRAYWLERDPRQVERAEADPHHRMALTFRWYLGMTSRWARLGEEDRKRDFQMWCGPAMGAFNEWAAGTDLHPVARRTVAGVAEALMQGAARLSRRQVARALGLPTPPISDR